MKRILFMSICLAAGLAAQIAAANQGVVVKGDNGTTWCCPTAPKFGEAFNAAGCNQSVNPIPASGIGKSCNFANLAAPGPSGTLKDDGPVLAPMPGKQALHLSGVPIAEGGIRADERMPPARKSQEVPAPLRP